MSASLQFYFNLNINCYFVTCVLFMIYMIFQAFADHKEDPLQNKSDVKG